MLFFKRICDVYDEEYLKALEQIGDAELTKGAMCHRIKIPERCHRNHVFNHTKNYRPGAKTGLSRKVLKNDKEIR